MDPVLLIMGALGVGVVVVTAALATLVMSCFKKCGADQVMVVGGLGTQDPLGDLAYKIIQPGKGVMVWPLIQQPVFMNVHIRNIEVSGSATTKDLMPCRVQASLGYKLSTDPQLLPKAVECFLNHEEEIDKTVRSMIIAQLNVFSRLYTHEELGSQWVAFHLGLKKAVEQDLNKIGVEMISFTVQETAKDSAAERSLPFR